MNQFALTLEEVSYQVWMALCAAAFGGGVPAQEALVERARMELWLHRDQDDLADIHVQFVSAVLQTS